MIDGKLVLALAIGYFLGSIPWGLLLTRVFGKGDLRAIGSGNIGATNVLRTGSRSLAAATLLLDAAKGAAAVWLVVLLIDRPGADRFAAAGALIGHLFPLWLGFRGGKGVATFLGILIPLMPVAALVYALLWIGLLLTIRISSVAGIAAAVSAPITAAIAGNQYLFPMLLGFALLVVWKHRENLQRLRLGTEPRVGRRSET